MGYSNKAMLAAHLYLKKVEELAALSRTLNEGLYEGIPESEVAYCHVRDLLISRHGDGAYLSVGLLMTSLVAFSHYTGHTDHEEYEPVKDQMMEVVLGLQRLALHKGTGNGEQIRSHRGGDGESS